MLGNNKYNIYDHRKKLSDELLSKILDFDKSQFPYPWTRESWTNFFNGRRHFVLCTLEGQELNGFSLFSVDVIDGNSELLKICVERSLCGKGIASSLFKKSLHYIDKNYGLNSIYLDVSALNHRAIKFYEKFGFDKVRYQKKFYTDQNDAHGMILLFNDSIKKSMLTE